MDATLTLMDLAGAIALLIWGVHTVQTGIMRAHCPSRPLTPTALLQPVIHTFPARQSNWVGALIQPRPTRRRG